jgi:hypothetical protein
MMSYTRQHAVGSILNEPQFIEVFAANVQTGYANQRTGPWPVPTNAAARGGARVAEW